MINIDEKAEFRPLGYYIEQNKPNPKYKAIVNLHKSLEEANIPHVFKGRIDGYQICYPNDNAVLIVCSVIEFTGTYGAEADKLEIMGLSNREDNVEGFLSEADVLNRIKKYHEAVEHNKLHFGG